MSDLMDYTDSDGSNLRLVPLYYPQRLQLIVLDTIVGRQFGLGITLPLDAIVELRDACQRFLERGEAATEGER